MAPTENAKAAPAGEETTTYADAAKAPAAADAKAAAEAAARKKGRTVQTPAGFRNQQLGVKRNPSQGRR